VDTVCSLGEYLAFVSTLDKVGGSTVLKLWAAVVVYERFTIQYKYSSMMTVITLCFCYYSKRT